VTGLQDQDLYDFNLVNPENPANPVSTFVIIASPLPGLLKNA
jgi:hypothetical protein